MSSNEMCGGCWTVPRPADEDTQEISNSVKHAVEKKTGKNYAVFTALLCQSQVVEGVNYAIMVYVGGNENLYVRVFQDLSGVRTVTGVERGPDPPETVLTPPNASLQQTQKL